MKFKYLFFLRTLSIGDCLLQPKLCINCKHFIKNEKNYGNEFGKCNAFSFIKDDDEFLITGIKKNIIIDYHYCSVARNSFILCGKIARKYQHNTKINNVLS